MCDSPGSTEPQAAFTSVAPYYDHLMRDVPYRNWVRHVFELASRHPIVVRSVLDLACGTGNVSELLAAMGHRVVGVDLSPSMIAQARAKARRRAPCVRYEVMDASELRLPGEAFDLCICLFDSLNYIVDPARLRKAVAAVHEHLVPGGLFIFDVNSVFALENSFFDQSEQDTSDRLRYVWRSEYDAPTRICTIRMRFVWRDSAGVDQEFHETHVQFAYEEAELRRMLAEAGFDAVEAFHAYSLGPVRPTSDRIFFMARRPTAP